eukprot:TRINITY_DN1655_c0_g1_i1.p2 TRINITY_DN1655_c0_g1~~TRINITY_DN1655_c0_g1_i1.p2  ORF type:complete len:74 (+),score=10.37 TRINITY_DN1655_c0_g1_i1:250-471(+)
MKDVAEIKEPEPKTEQQTNRTIERHSEEIQETIIYTENTNKKIVQQESNTTRKCTTRKIRTTIIRRKNRSSVT